MGLHPAFMQDTAACPVSGPLPWQATDLDLTISHRSRQFSARAMQDIPQISDTSSELTVAPGESLAGPRSRVENSRWAVAIAASCLIHGALAATLLTSPAARNDSQDSAQTEGSDRSGANVVGSALNSESSAVNVALVPAPQPPKPAQPTAPVRPAEAPRPQPSPEAVERKPIQPDILVASAPRDDAESVVQDDKKPAPTETQTESPPPVPAQPPIPTARPVLEKPREAEDKSGTADGRNRSERTASRGRKQTEVGTVAEASYRSDVIRKLGRVYRAVPPSLQATARTNTVVTFVIGRQGNVDELRVVESSGSTTFDQIVLGFVRKAAPFPPIPAKVGNSLEFTGAIGPF